MTLLIENILSDIVGFLLETPFFVRRDRWLAQLVTALVEERAAYLSQPDENSMHWERYVPEALEQLDLEKSKYEKLKERLL